MPASTQEFEERISGLDLRLFERIVSQTSDNEKRSMLACQLGTRELTEGYVYLEIGSYLGGSIQPHLLDPLCRHIYSIDKRPFKQPDSRGLTYRYKDNSTERMLGLLKEVDAAALDKVTCLDGDTEMLRPEQVERTVDLCMVDAEHTDEAILRDFEFCLSVMGDNGALIFHDAQVVYNGLWEALDRLKLRERPFHAYNIPDGLMVIELGDFPLHRQPFIAEQLLDNYVGYLGSMRAVDYLRRWANVPPVRIVRAVRARLKGDDTAP